LAIIFPGLLVLGGPLFAVRDNGYGFAIVRMRNYFRSDNPFHRENGVKWSESTLFAYETAYFFCKSRQLQVQCDCVHVLERYSILLLFTRLCVKLFYAFLLHLGDDTVIPSRSCNRSVSSLVET